MRSKTSTIELNKTNVNQLTPFRSATAVDLRRHYAVKSVYTNTSTIYIKRKFNFRSVSVPPTPTHEGNLFKKKKKKKNN